MMDSTVRDVGTLWIMVTFLHGLAASWAKCCVSFILYVSSILNFKLSTESKILRESLIYNIQNMIWTVLLEDVRTYNSRLFN